MEKAFLGSPVGVRDGTGVIVDPSPAAPPAAMTWFYLLRDHVTPGNYGQDWLGRDRLPASGTDCP